MARPKWVLKKRHSSGREETVFSSERLEDIGRFVAEKATGLNIDVGVDNRGWFDEF